MRPAASKPRANLPKARLARQLHSCCYAFAHDFYKPFCINRAKNLLATCRILVDEHDSQVPASRQALEALPGVGRKTANVVLNVAFGQPTLAVDTHIFRLGNRCGLGPGKTPLEVEQKLLKRIPPEFMQHAHHWLILHGRYICQARKPKCGECAVYAPCGFKAKGEFAQGAAG